MKKLLSVLISFIIVLSFQFIHATSLENGSFETDWTFVDGDHAYGMVTINGIATLPQPDTYDQGNVYLDIFAGGVRNVIAADSTITLSNNLDIFGTINMLECFEKYDFFVEKSGCFFSTFSILFPTCDFFENVKILL